MGLQYRRGGSLKQTAVLLSVLTLAAVATADSLNVRLVGSCALPGGFTFGEAASGEYVYVANGDSGLRVIAIADPTQPTEVGYIDTRGMAYGVELVGDLAYVADGDSGLQIVSIADPEHPVDVGHCLTSGCARGLAVSGDYAYVASDSGLRVVSIVDPAHPAEVGRYHMTSGAFAVAVVGSHAYVGGMNSGFWVISVADPANPSFVGNCGTPDRVYGVAVSGSYAYVACEDSGMRVISVADPAHPVEVGCLIDSAFVAIGLALDGTRVYVAGGIGCNSFQVISVADPTQPVEVGYYGGVGEHSVAYAGDYALVGGHRALYIMQYIGSGAKETEKVAAQVLNCATVVRGVLFLPEAPDHKLLPASLLDVSGRRVLSLHSGANDIHGLAPGIYFVRSGLSAVSRERSAVARVVIAR
jgi:hypothetical protein